MSILWVSSLTPSLVSQVEGLNSLLPCDDKKVRQTIYQRAFLDPPSLSPIGVAVIAGELTLTRPQYLKQFQISRSMYMANGQTFRFFVGLKDVSTDLETASYYWLLRFVAPDAHRPDFWTETATKEQLLDFCRKRLEGSHEDFLDILRWQTEEGMLRPLAIRDMLPRLLPDGLATTLGDACHPMSNCERFI